MVIVSFVAFVVAILLFGFLFFSLFQSDKN